MVLLDEKQRTWKVAHKPLDIIRAILERGGCCPNNIILGIMKYVKLGNPYNAKSVHPANAGSYVDFLFQSKPGDLQERRRVRAQLNQNMQVEKKWRTSCYTN
jgi:hypothetical protein